ncbi:CBS domain-containing protein [Candidatus Halobeggiatoa sp. HSG11]|nr:CBS domain-containing protein [Candidatus Halobeggiatoa sp. HSG11]
MQIQEVLTQKTSGIFSIEATKTMLSAVKEMYKKRTAALLVQSETGETVGILTERDVLGFYAKQQGDANQITVAEVMTKKLFVETLDSTVDKAEFIMTTKKIRHLPIVDDGKVIGIVSIGDLVKAQLQETAVEAKSLSDYIVS